MVIGSQTQAKADYKKEWLRKKLLEDPEYRSRQFKRWRAENLDSERARVRKWKKENPGKNTSIENSRRVRKLNQRCICCTDSLISSFYEQAAAIGKEVDHVVPLRLGGLHCINNLQHLDHDEHLKKTAKDISEIAEYRRKTSRYKETSNYLSGRDL